jgi:hypothetical protein
MHVGAVQVTGLQINIPPREMREQAPEKTKEHKGKIHIIVDEIFVDRSRLTLGTSNPDQDPKDFELRRMKLHNVGPNAPWRYDATC